MPGEIVPLYRDVVGGSVTNTLDARRVRPETEGRIDIHPGGVMSMSGDILNRHDDVAEQIYAALCADSDIMAAAYDVESQWSARSHRPSQDGKYNVITFNLKVKGKQYPPPVQPNTIFYMLGYTPDDVAEVINTGDGGSVDVLTPSEYTLKIQPTVHQNPLEGRFEGIVPEEDLGSVAVGETRRMLEEYGLMPK